MGTSTRPVLFTLPTNEKIFVPLLVFVPMPVNHSAPLSIMQRYGGPGLDVIEVGGFPQIPLTDVRTYFGRGSPTLPSMAHIKALDSPLTKAPAPRWTRTSKAMPEPRTPGPSRPYSCAWSSAKDRFSTAMGYSWRT